MMNTQAGPGEAAAVLAAQAVANGALQKATELAWLIDIIRARPRPKRILEIGSWEAGTLWLWRQLADEVWSIDIRPVPHRDWMDDRVHLVTERSAYARPLVPASFDLVFIDGDHSTPGVKTDWGLYSSLAPVIAIHDIVPWAPTPDEVAQGYGERGVEELWHWIKASYTTLEFSDPATQTWPDGRSIDHREGGIGVVFMEHVQCAGFGLEGPPCSSCPGDDRCPVTEGYVTRRPGYDASKPYGGFPGRALEISGEDHA